MKAIRVHRTGGPEVLEWEEVPDPEPGPGEVLVKVYAAGVNPPDWYARSGFATIPPDRRPPWPLPFTPGTDVSGVVTGLGAGAAGWQLGDQVFGMLRFPQRGANAYAEYVSAPVGDLAGKPAEIDHLTAAAVPMAGLTAYQFIAGHLKLEKGRTVLVNGAAGGVGHFAVQLAKARGATVIGVASGRHQDFLSSLGVDRFVDYTTVDVAAEVHDVDVLIDTVGGPDGHRLLPVLRDGGVISPVFSGDYHADEAAQRGITFVKAQVHADGEQLAELARMLDEGTLRAAVDSMFPLSEAWRAHDKAEQGHLQGKIVLTVV
jgi:NADPH:quinone reductase-like Zn-dependent oxidoreductase